MSRVTARKQSRRSQHTFAQIPSVEIPRSQFNRSFGLKTGFDAGYLVPIFVDEALPGDTLNLRMNSFMRLATPAKAFMDNLYADFFFFAVPIRLIWANWQKFCGEQTDPGDSIAYSCPKMTENVADDSLSDYLGIPTGKAGLEFNSFWHRSYALIWNEWFRDENLQDSVVVDTDDGPDTSTDYVLLKRGKRHDYFSSALPFTQKGTPVEMPIGATAPVEGSGDLIPIFDQASVSGMNLETAAGATPVVAWVDAGTGTHVFGEELKWNDPKLQADLSSATGPLINEIREAFQVQRLMERDARGGTRYTEILRSHFGVVSPDQRLQRPEYLGGGSTRISVNPVAATTGVSIVSGFGTQMSSGIGFVKSFTEHCCLLGLVNVRADITYQQGLNRMFSRDTRYDFYWPALAHLGEQEVLNKELYAQGTAGGTDDDDVFGYQERYAEYRYKPSLTTGVMRSSHATSLDVWHLGLKFTSLPLLNDVFIEDNPPVERVLVTSSDTQLIADFYFDYKCARPMPTYSVPGLVDHF